MKQLAASALPPCPETYSEKLTELMQAIEINAKEKVHDEV
jgi:hypothetical protein